MYLNDTWLYDGTSWVPWGGAGPGRRADHTMVYDAHRQAVTIFGGDTQQWPADLTRGFALRDEEAIFNAVLALTQS